MKFLAITSLGFAAVAVAQNSTASAAATGCVASYNTCRQPTNGVSANQAYCASQNAQCQGDCYSAYNTCRQPTNGVSANQASCASGYASCLGENPFSSDGSLTLKPITAGGSSTTSSAAAASTAQCQAAYDKCRQPTNGVSANQAQCAAEFAGCLGTNPFASNGTNTVTGGITYTTEVVTALTTYCPAATTLTVNNKVYTVSSATTLTIKDCPCTISKPVTSATWTASTTGAVTTGGKTNGTATTSKPVAYTGAASHMGAGFGLLGAAAGAVMLL